MAKVLCVLYDDPVGEYPRTYARDKIPKLERYPGGQSLPTPKGIDFKPGQLLGCVSGELGLRKFLRSTGPHTGRDRRKQLDAVRFSTTLGKQVS